MPGRKQTKETTRMQPYDKSKSKEKISREFKLTQIKKLCPKAGIKEQSHNATQYIHKDLLPELFQELVSGSVLFMLYNTRDKGSVVSANDLAKVVEVTKNKKVVF